MLSPRLGSLSALPRLTWAFTALMAAGEGMALLVPMAAPSTLAPLANAVGLVMMNVGYSWLYMCWMELYARMDVMHVVAYFSLAHLCSALLSFALTMVSQAWFAATCLLLIPIVSTLLYALSLSRSEGASFMRGELPVSGWSFPVRPVVLLGTFTFANNFVRHFLSDELKGVVLVGVMLAAAFVILLLAARSERFEMGVLYSASLPLIVAASLCVLFPAAGFGVAGAILSNAAYALFSIFTTSVLCSISYGYGVSAPWLFGFAQAAVSAGTLVSNLIVGRFDFVESDPMLLTATTSIVVMAFVSLYAVFSGSGDSSGSWGIERMGAQSEDPLDDLQDSCARVSRRFGLTRREEQVMALLVQGDSFAQVEEKLSISNSTMKTHARHVYAKVGVSGRAELGEFVRRYR